MTRRSRLFFIGWQALLSGLFAARGNGTWYGCGAAKRTVDVAKAWGSVPCSDRTQLVLSINLEKRQLKSDHRNWDEWLANVEGDLQGEPQRVRKFYEVASFRIEPVGLAYLWPVTG